MSQTAARTTYDEVPYASYPYSVTHPDHLAVMGALFGLEPPAAETCRVLELGCAGGGNLIPMADTLPEAEFLGIDLSGRQVDEGRAVLSALDLDNVRLEQADIMGLDRSLGTFDYIICHGVYSWVPPEVQRRILEIVREQLAPQGIGYVSYNTYPGWHMRGMVREMMRYHAARFDEVPNRIGQSRALLDFLIQAAGADGTAYGRLLRDEAELLRAKQDTYLFHEHLEENNEPVYFHQFAERARDAGLRYLAEAELKEMLPGMFPAETEQTLRRIAPDIIHMEQYLDFLRNRTFRRTLLCHHERELERDLGPASARKFHVASPLAPAQQHDGSAARTFQHPGGGKATVESAVQDAALRHLGEAWPRAVAFEELLDVVCLQLGGDAPREDSARRIGELVIECYASGLVELRLAPQRYTTSVSERPRGGRIARFQAGFSSTVTNRRHEKVRLGELDRKVLCLLDGTRDRPSIVNELVLLARQGELKIGGGDCPDDPEALRRLLDAAVPESLRRLAHQALVVA